MVKSPAVVRRLALRAGLLAPLLGALALSGCTLSSGTSAPAALSSAPPPAASAPGSAADLQTAFVNVVKTVGPSVVQVQTDLGLGSGIVFDAAGDIVTNDHVVQGATKYKVTLANGKSYDASLVGRFAADDLAVLRISAPSLVAAVFADSSRLQVGDIVMAIGNPLGLQSSVTEGIVSAVGRTENEPSGAVIPDMIQTSASINPGNSGGALVDLDGHVVGIPTLAATDPQLGGSAPGIGFAISSNTARDIAQQLIQSGHVTNSRRAYLGVKVGDAQTGVYVNSVVPGGPAAKAGIKAGDLITAVDGKPTPDTGTLADVLANLKPGQTIKVAITHSDGSTATVQLTLGELPGS